MNNHFSETKTLLQQALARIEQEVAQRKEVEIELQQAKENLEEQVKQRTCELTQTNARLTQEIQERIAAEAEVRRLNNELENRVRERTIQLAQSNQELLQEIRDRQLLEEKLHISESKLRAVLEAMTDIVIVLEDNRTIEVIPTNVLSLYQPGIEIIDQTVKQFFEDGISEDLWLQFARVLETQQMVNFDYILPINDCHYWFTACISPMSANTAIWVARDISDRCQAELALRQKNEELANALEELKNTQKELIHSEKMAALGQLIAGIAHEINTPLAAIRASVENIIEFLTKNVEQLLTFLQNLSPERRQDFFAILHQSTQHPDTLSSKEKRLFKKALQHQLQSQGFEEVESLACTLVDIGFMGEIEAFLPLLTASNSLSILQTAYEFSAAQRSARTIATATERAARVVFALKNYARHDPSDQKVLTNITDGIETVLILYQNYLKQGVEVLKNYQKDLPLLLCYPDELNQVWTNLIQNALQAMENQGVLQIDIKQQNTSLLVSITDSGKGILPEIHSRIFEPFFTTKPPGEGCGLGLNIVKKILDQHQGKIELESVSGKTTFTVFLPLDIN